MKKIYLLFLLTFVWLGAFAQPVSQQEALKSANRFLKSHSTKSAGAIITSSDLIYVSSNKSTDAYYYVFKLPVKGFIIMSGEKASLPVFGYSFENEFNPSDIPINMQSMLIDYQSEIKYLRENNVLASEATIKDSEDILDNRHQLKSSVSPLLGSIKWNQRPYYNALCPTYNSSGSRCPVGCVATAMAQILRYWEYPNKGRGSHSYKSRYGTLYVNFNSTYDWSSMPRARLTGPNSHVAKLSYHCAVSINMNFGPNGSGAYQSDVPAALVNYFKYPNTVSTKYRSHYTSQQWHNLLKTELNAGRPVQYAGHGDGGGHSFVCDGYNSNGYFHYNWGWGGSSDGYFLTNALNPGSLGTGGGTGGFNSNQQILVGFQAPNNSGGDDEDPPEQPRDLRTTNVTTNSAVLRWDAAESVDSYRVRIKTVGGEWQYFNTSTNNLQVNSLTVETKYYWSVSATNEYGSSSYPATVSFTTLSAGGSNEAPAKPTGLLTQNITSSTATLKWDAVDNADSYKVAIKTVDGEWQFFTSDNISLDIVSLEESTKYYWKVRAVSNYGSSDYATLANFTTDAGGTPIDYCSSHANSSNYEWINYFSIGNMSNESTNANGGYSDFTNKVVNVKRGQRHIIYFRAGYKKTVYKGYWSIWIDFDKNGIFDSNELVLKGTSSLNKYLKGYITIPASAKLGETRLRISMSEQAYRSPCEVFSYGEVEDYTVNITSRSSYYATHNSNANSDAVNISDADLEMCVVSPNPATDVVKISLNDLQEAMPVKIYDQEGRIVKEIVLNTKESEVDIRNLRSGVYFIVIEREKSPLTTKVIKY